MQLKNLLIAGMLTAASSTSFAQLDKTEELKKAFTMDQLDTVAWIRSGQFNLGFTEGFLHNWSAGGELASIQVNGIFAGNWTHLNHNRKWSNDLLLAYGLNYIYSNDFVPRKVDDRIDFTSKYGVRIKNSKWLATGLLNFRTQFTKGYDYKLDNWQNFPVSNFLSPAYLTLGLGAEYVNNDFSLFVSPLSARFTFADKYYTMLHEAGSFGIPYGKTSRFELGAYLSARYQRQLSKNVTYRTRLDLYSNYLAKDRTLPDGTIHKDNPGNIDVLFDNYLGIKISKYISVAVGLTMIYDNDYPYSKTYLDPVSMQQVEKDVPGNNLGWIQINQLLNIGFSYKF